MLTHARRPKIKDLRPKVTTFQHKPTNAIPNVRQALTRPLAVTLYRTQAASVCSDSRFALSRCETGGIAPLLLCANRLEQVDCRRRPCFGLETLQVVGNSLSASAASERAREVNRSAHLSQGVRTLFPSPISAVAPPRDAGLRCSLDSCKNRGDRALPSRDPLVSVPDEFPRRQPRYLACDVTLRASKRDRMNRFQSPVAQRRPFETFLAS